MEAVESDFGGQVIARFKTGTFEKGRALGLCYQTALKKY
jgi:hypothetical protein